MYSQIEQMYSDKTGIKPIQFSGLSARLKWFKFLFCIIKKYKQDTLATDMRNIQLGSSASREQLYQTKIMKITVREY